MTRVAPADVPGTDVEMRRRVLQHVNRYPGLHLREIQRRVGSSVHLVEYHLNVLERLGLVASQEEGGYRRFFPAQGERATPDAKDRAWLGLLRQSVPLGVALYLLDKPGATHGEISDVVPVTKSTLTYHLKNMLRAGLVTRDAARALRLADAARVLVLLRTHRPTPDLIAAWGEMWNDIVGTLQTEGDPDVE